MIPAAQALQRLQEGNHRFVSGEVTFDARITEERRRLLADGQEPMAAVLGCSDSRVPVELVFDQGVGDLFVIRVAGNIVLPSQAGSVEFAVEQLGVRLVVVMGHSGCGAVRAALTSAETGQDLPPGNVGPIVEEILPLARSTQPGAPDDPDAWLDRAVRANVRESVRRLSTTSARLRPRVEAGEVTILGAHYTVASGAVEFFDRDADRSG